MASGPQSPASSAVLWKGALPWPLITLPSVTRVTVTCSFLFPPVSPPNPVSHRDQERKQGDRAKGPGHGCQGAWQCASFLVVFVACFIMGYTSFLRSQKSNTEIPHACADLPGNTSLAPPTCSPLNHSPAVVTTNLFSTLHRNRVAQGGTPRTGFAALPSCLVGCRCESSLLATECTVPQPHRNLTTCRKRSNFKARLLLHHHSIGCGNMGHPKQGTVHGIPRHGWTVISLDITHERHLARPVCHSEAAIADQRHKCV